MKKILIPTDFNKESIKIIDALVQAYPGEKFTVIFTHAFKLSDSITDMLMLKRRSKDHENVSLEFYQAMDARQGKYENISGIGIEYFYGSTVSTFKNFIDALNISAIAYPLAYNFTPLNKYSIDPKYLTQRAGIEVITLDINNLNPENLMDSKINENRLQQTTI